MSEKCIICDSKEELKPIKDKHICMNCIIELEALSNEKTEG